MGRVNPAGACPQQTDRPAHSSALLHYSGNRHSQMHNWRSPHQKRRLDNKHRQLGKSSRISFAVPPVLGGTAFFTLILHGFSSIFKRLLYNTNNQ